MKEQKILCWFLLTFVGYSVVGFITVGFHWIVLSLSMLLSIIVIAYLGIFDRDFNIFLPESRDD